MICFFNLYFLSLIMFLMLSACGSIFQSRRIWQPQVCALHTVVILIIYCKHRGQKKSLKKSPMHILLQWIMIYSKCLTEPGNHLHFKQLSKLSQDLYLSRVTLSVMLKPALETLGDKDRGANMNCHRALSTHRHAPRYGLAPS